MIRKSLWDVGYLWYLHPQGAKTSLCVGLAGRQPGWLPFKSSTNHSWGDAEFAGHKGSRHTQVDHRETGRNRPGVRNGPSAAPVLEFDQAHTLARIIHEHAEPKRREHG